MSSPEPGPFPPADPAAPGPASGTSAPSSTPRAKGGRPLVGVLVAIVALLALAVSFLAGQVSSRPSSSAPVAAAPGATAPSAAATGAGTPRTTTPAQAAPAATGPVPAGATAFGGPMVVNPSAAAGVSTLDLFEDPQCPICKQFEQIYGPTIANLVATGKAKLVVHTMTFLDGNLRNDSSVRGANASFCAADQGKFMPFSTALYAGQPAHEGDGWTDAQLEAFAVQAGVADLATWRTCQSSLRYAAHIAALETNSERSGVNGTPTLKINGTQVRLTGNPTDITSLLGPASPTNATKTAA